ncbi:uncharacterized protein LOC116350064 [Contarinia nasturtii]|uniref:uncharacterized protein LOC116350064 n=1 Tax=Contarinia nasturtii TaxID=265458 RepID=UPI0012D3DF2F|nr:uncharacterized protein LOC116350064 [Contarinia nasturtii]
MDMKVEFKKQLNQIEKLDHFVVLYGKKGELYHDLLKLKDQTHEIKCVLFTCLRVLKEIQIKNHKKFKALIENSQNQQILLLQVLEKIIFPTNNADLTNEIEEINLCSLAEISNTPCKLPVFKSTEQPIMKLADYVKSPYATKLRPPSIQFSDFEKNICVEEFMKIPGYMRGREILEEIQQFSDSVIIKSFTIKYALISKRKEAVTSTEMDLYNLYKSQEEYFRGSKFITQGDICRLTDKQMDKKTMNRICILRHLKVIREERKNAAICYIWKMANLFKPSIPAKGETKGEITDDEMCAEDNHSPTIPAIINVQNN